MADWDANGPQLQANLSRVAPLARDAMRARALPTLGLMRRFHAEMMQGLDVPDANWVGRYRGEPGAENVGARLGRHFGSAPGVVAAELADFQQRLQAAIHRLDQLIAPRQQPDADQLAAILDLSAWAHAEWVRIHPFANGNGRTARLWVNMIAERYELPPYITLRPRPAGDRYAASASAAMTGNWRALVPVLREMYLAAI